MRCFVAVVPPVEAMVSLRDDLARTRTRWPELSWVPSERWHVTVAFLGDVDEARRTALEGALTPLGATSQMSLAVSGAGWFPNARRARILWAGITGDVDELTGLARQTSRAASRVIGPSAERAFRPHITVARARRPFADGAEVENGLAGLQGDPFSVREFVLMRSHLGPTPRYEPLAVWPLQPTAD